MTIGFGIATQSRCSMFLECLQAVARFAPEDAVIVVCDDCSNDKTVETLEAWLRDEGDQRVEIIRHATIEGICRTKTDLINKICVHPEVTDVFLVEDDVLPVKEKWFMPFIETAWQHGQAHLLYLPTPMKYGRTFRVDDDQSEYPIAWKQFNSGMVMYFRRALLDEVGGFDPGLIRYGYDHNEMTARCLIAQWMCPDLNPHCIAAETAEVLLCRDVEAEKKGQNIPSSMDKLDKSRLAKANQQLYMQRMASYRAKFEAVKTKTWEEKTDHRRKYYFKADTELVQSDRSSLL